MALLCYRRHRFPPEISQHAIWLYLRFTLSYRDVEVLVAERRLDLSHETMRRWVFKFNAGSFPKPHAGQRQRCPALATETPRRCILLDPAAQANSEHSVQLDRRAHRRTADRSLRCESRRWQLCREPCGNAPRKGRPAAAGEGGIEPARPDQRLIMPTSRAAPITLAPSRNSKTRWQILPRTSIGPRWGSRRTGLMPCSGRSANCWSSR